MHKNEASRSAKPGEGSPVKIDSFDGIYSFLSNFYPWEIVDVDGFRWQSTEHYYQAAKTDDAVWKKMIAAAPFYKTSRPQGGSIASVKALGRSCPIVANWEDIRLSVMEKALRMKFKKGNLMAEMLIATGDAELIEGNHWRDTFFGVCDGKGQNHLGKLLMKIREELKTAEATINGEKST